MEDYRKKESENLVNKGIELLNLGEYESAIDIFNAAIKLYDDNAEAYYKRASSYRNLEEYDKAINHWC